MQIIKINLRSVDRVNTKAIQVPEYKLSAWTLRQQFRRSLCENSLREQGFYDSPSLSNLRVKVRSHVRINL